MSDFTSMKVKELQEYCITNDIVDPKGLKKKELLDKIFLHTHKENRFRK